MMSSMVNDVKGDAVCQSHLIIHGFDKVVHDHSPNALSHRLIEQNITVDPYK